MGKLLKLDKYEYPDLVFSEICEEYQQPIYHFFVRLTQCESDAEDLTQETFIKINHGLATFRGEARLSTWVYRIATNISIDYFRKDSTKQRKRACSIEEIEYDCESIADADVCNPEQMTAQIEMSACVQNFIADLPIDYRTVLVMHDLQSLKNREIADILECSLDTVKIRLHRARNMLREALNSNCDFTRDEQNVFICEPISIEKSIIRLDIRDC